jgi:deoxyribonuclease V
MVESPWPEGIAPAQARLLQEELRDQVLSRPPEGFSPELVAGADLSVVRGRDVGHAAIVVVQASNLRPVAHATASVPVEFPYVPGLLSFRELPPLAEAWRKLRVRPDVVMFDAHGLAHPRRFGLACHGGLLFDVPSIGVAKSVLVGDYAELGEEKGARASLRHEGREVGVALRTRTGISPVFVSIGHRMDLETAVKVVLTVTPCYRIPEPIRRAHRMSNQVRAGSYS